MLITEDSIYHPNLTGTKKSWDCSLLRKAIGPPSSRWSFHHLGQQTISRSSPCETTFSSGTDMTHPLLLVSERIVSRDKGMRPAEVLFIVMHIQLEKSNCYISRRIRRWKNLFYWQIFNLQNFVWKFSYCNRYVAYFNYEDIYTKCCALIKTIKSSSVFFPTAQRNVTGLCWVAGRHCQSTK